MHAILLTNTLMRDNGQASSALDLALAARSRGVAMRIAVMIPPVFGLERANPDLVARFGAEDVFLVPYGVRSVANPQEQISAYRRVRRALVRSVRTWHQLRGHRAACAGFERADVVVVATALSYEGLAALRARTSARLVFNHAGSVDSFRDYWLAPSQMPPDLRGGAPDYRAFVRQYDAVVFQAADQRDECAALVPAIRERLLTVRPSVEEDALRSAPSEPSPFVPGRTSIVNVGSLQPRKAQHVSLEAFAALATAFPSADLHFVGEAFRREYAARLERLAIEHGVSERVFFHGHRTDYGRFLAHADVVLHSSLSEGVSRVFREAMFLARPIVATDLSGTCDTLENGVSALLAEPDDAPALAAALRRVLEDREMAARLGAAAALRYRERHAGAVYAAAVEAMLHEVAALDPAPGGAPRRPPAAAR